MVAIWDMRSVVIDYKMADIQGLVRREMLVARGVTARAGRVCFAGNNLPGEPRLWRSQSIMSYSLIVSRLFHALKALFAGGVKKCGAAALWLREQNAGCAKLRLDHCIKPPTIVKA